MSRVLVFSCVHTPCMHPLFPEFLGDMRRKWKTDKTICLGDLSDNRVINYHEKNPDLPSGLSEYTEAKKQVALLVRQFPLADVLVGNHDALPTRQATTAAIPSWFIKDMPEVWGTKKWVWHPRFTTIEHDGVLYRHGDKGKGGNIRPALLNAMENFKSLVQGHFHALLQTIWHFNETSAIFGMQVGCGIDRSRPEMEYGLRFNHKPALGCGIVIDGKDAFTERMHL